MEPPEDATQSMNMQIPISDTTINKITLAEPIKVWQSNRHNSQPVRIQISRIHTYR